VVAMGTIVEGGAEAGVTAGVAVVVNLLADVGVSSLENGNSWWRPPPRGVRDDYL
jgi:hypothetical protein